jgi:hypothetical protein
MRSYFIEVIGPDLVRVHEESASYPMSRVEAQENIEVIKASRAKYPSDEIYLRRLGFYEDILAAFTNKGA